MNENVQGTRLCQKANYYVQRRAELCLHFVLLADKPKITGYTATHGWNFIVDYKQWENILTNGQKYQSTFFCITGTNKNWLIQYQHSACQIYQQKHLKLLLSTYN